MGIELAVGAAIGCAVSNAIAAILQKTSSEKAATIRGYNVGIFVQLVRQLPYTAGLVFDLAAGICTLIAVNRLPLFVVQAIIASCVVLTALLERIFLHRILRMQTYYAAAIVLIGLICVGVAAHSEGVATVSPTLKYTLAALPLLFVVLGAVVVRIRRKAGAFILAALSGLAFGCDSIIGRIMIYPHPIWLVVKNPLFWSLVAYGVIGMFYFTAALQRTLATIVNGLMTSTQTIVPLVVGIVLLGDTARSGLWLPLWIGCLLVIGGCFYIAYTD